MKEILDGRTAEILDQIQRNPKASSLEMEMRRWRLTYARYVQDRDRLEQFLKADHAKRNLQYKKDEGLRRLRHLKQEIADYQKVVNRLVSREKMLMEAIQAGVFMTGPEMKQIGKIGNAHYRKIVKTYESN